MVSLCTPELFVGSNFLRNLVISGCQSLMDFRLSDIYGLQATRHPENSDYQTSMDSRLPDIRKFQTTRHLWTPGYQTSDIYGLQADIRKFQTTRHLWTPGYQTSDIQATRHPVICFHQLFTFNWPYSNFLISNTL